MWLLYLFEPYFSNTEVFVSNIAGLHLSNEISVNKNINNDLIAHEYANVLYIGQEIENSINKPINSLNECIINVKIPNSIRPGKVITCDFNTTNTSVTITNKNSGVNIMTNKEVKNDIQHNSRKDGKIK